MAGRFNTYRPNEFVKLPFEDVVKAMAMREQQYEQGYLASPKYQQVMGQIETRDVDQPYAQELINNATKKAEELAKTTYGGDYGAAAMDITRTLANEANNPFYKFNKSAVKDWDEAKKLKSQLQAEGKYIGFNEDIFNKSYYNSKTGEVNTDIKHDLQKQLDYSDEMMKIWNYGLHEETTGSKADLASAESQNKAGKAFIELKKYRVSGINQAQIDAKDEQALALYMDTNAYKQQKRLLTEKQGLSESDADAKIAADMLQAGKFKKFKSIIDDSTVMSGSNNSNGSTNDIANPITQAKAGDNATPNPQHTRNLENFKNNIYKNLLFKTISVTPEGKEYSKKYSELKTTKDEMVKRAGDPQESSTNRLYATREIAKLSKELGELENTYTTKFKSKPINSLSKENKAAIANDPTFQGMKGVVYSVLNNPQLKFEDAERILEEMSNSVQNNRYIESRNHKMSFNTDEIQKNLILNIKNFATDSKFNAIDEGGGKKYKKEDILSYLKEDPDAGVVVRGDGELIFTINTKDDGLKTIKINKESFSDAQKKQLQGVQAVEDIYRRYGSLKDGTKVTGDKALVKIPILIGGQKLYPSITPGGISDPNTGLPSAEMLDSNGKLVGYLSIDKVLDSYHKGFIGTNTRYTLTQKAN